MISPATKYVRNEITYHDAVIHDLHPFVDLDVQPLLT